jgi:hypothetical protein
VRAGFGSVQAFSRREATKTVRGCAMKKLSGLRPLSRSAAS